MEELGFKSRSVWLYYPYKQSMLPSIQFVKPELCFTLPLSCFTFSPRQAYFLHFLIYWWELSATCHHQWASPKTGCLPTETLQRPTCSLSTGSSINLPYTAETKGLFGLCIPPWFASFPVQVGKESRQTHLLSPPLMVPIPSYILSQKKHRFKGTWSQMGSMTGILKHTEFQNMKSKRKVYPTKKMLNTNPP